mmetsp:Transcript_39349/g.127922  ORF Transcript_39349/g.127922 Transcript_39349/m.127922 type:complete len:273 (+) Transcript_39349:298-1116(+)
MQEAAAARGPALACECTGSGGRHGAARGRGCADRPRRERRAARLAGDVLLRIGQRSASSRGEGCGAAGRVGGRGPDGVGRARGRRAICGARRGALPARRPRRRRRLAHGTPRAGERTGQPRQRRRRRQRRQRQRLRWQRRQRRRRRQRRFRPSCWCRHPRGWRRGAVARRDGGAVSHAPRAALRRGRRDAWRGGRAVAVPSDPCRHAALLAAGQGARGRTLRSASRQPRDRQRAVSARKQLGEWCREVLTALCRSLSVVGSMLCSVSSASGV